VFAAPAQGFKKALTHRRDADAKLSPSVIDDGLANERLLEGLVLNNFEGTDTPPLNPAAQEQPAVSRRRQKDGACRRQVRSEDSVFRYANGVLEDRRVDVVAGAHMNTTHKLDKLPRFGLIMAAGLVDGLADQAKGHFQKSRDFNYLRYGESYIFGRYSPQGYPGKRERAVA
jgi:hypothetical protein